MTHIRGSDIVCMVGTVAVLALIILMAMGVFPDIPQVKVLHVHRL